MLIFIVLLVAIVITGNLATKFFSVIAPHGHSRTLGIVIVSFVGVFPSAAVVFMVFYRPV